MSDGVERESVVVSAVITNTVVTNNSEKGDKSLTTDEVCRSHLQNTTLDDQGSNDQTRRRDTLTELTSQSISSPIQLRLREIVISMKRRSAKLKGNAVGVVM